MMEGHIAESCLINSGIASGNMMINSQKTLMDQFYRTSGGAGGGFFSGSAKPTTGMPPPGMTQFQFFKRDSSSDGNEFSEEEGEDLEEEKVPQYRDDDSF